MKKLLGWIVVLAAVLCLVQYLRAVWTATAFNTFLQEQAGRLHFQNPQMVEEGILVRADDSGIYLHPDDLVVVADGDNKSVYATYTVPVNVFVTEWRLERTYSTED
jgi:hypothetical protein